MLNRRNEFERGGKTQLFPYEINVSQLDATDSMKVQAALGNKYEKALKENKALAKKVHPDMKDTRVNLVLSGLEENREQFFDKLKRIAINKFIKTATENVAGIFSSKEEKVTIQVANESGEQEEVLRYPPLVEIITIPGCIHTDWSELRDFIKDTRKDQKSPLYKTYVELVCVNPMDMEKFTKSIRQEKALGERFIYVIPDPKIKLAPQPAPKPPAPQATPKPPKINPDPQAAPKPKKASKKKAAQPDSKSASSQDNNKSTKISGSSSAIVSSLAKAGASPSTGLQAMEDDAKNAGDTVMSNAHSSSNSPAFIPMDATGLKKDSKDEKQTSPTPLLKDDDDDVDMSDANSSSHSSSNSSIPAKPSVSPDAKKRSDYIKRHMKEWEDSCDKADKLCEQVDILLGRSKSFKFTDAQNEGSFLFLGMTLNQYYRAQRRFLNKFLKKSSKLEFSYYLKEDNVTGSIVELNQVIREFTSAVRKRLTDLSLLTEEAVNCFTEEAVNCLKEMTKILEFFEHYVKSSELIVNRYLCRIEESRKRKRDDSPPPRSFISDSSRNGSSSSSRNDSGSRSSPNPKRGRFG